MSQGRPRGAAGGQPNKGWPKPMQVAPGPAQPIIYSQSGGARAPPNAPSGQVAGALPQQGRPKPGVANQGNGQVPFMGICNGCQVVGHRLSQCPYRVCFSCQQQGHFATECPSRQQAQVEVSCQVCGAKGAVFAQCPRCVEFRRYLENAKGGGQSNFFPPNPNSRDRVRGSCV
ncbi:DNA-binding protein HEXBP-like [Leptopilina heterotoma]|uniref:DNA-binding protein HEXBP-like n=1 Tax=Leptopilina heterotoma TaxID=63436 RepID=UPI001CA87E06|nr:DNA-binding protein HEXBP-like [Leptopilina heterotoma]